MPIFSHEIIFIKKYYFLVRALVNQLPKTYTVFYTVFVNYSSGRLMLFDLTGALISLLSTYFFIRMNNKAWLVGIAATCLNGWLYWRKGIYADMVLEALYFLSMSYGWYQWNKPVMNDTHDFNGSLNYLSPIQWGFLFLLLGIVFILIQYLLQAFTHSTVATLDAATTSLSLVAQWLMCHKIIVTWILWFITDAIYAFMYFHKNLPFHSLLMLIYTGMAITGYLLWARKVKVMPLDEAIA
jgi:nicotinamide mononucleotide transporter